jgi:hypothetical protein
LSALLVLFCGLVLILGSWSAIELSYEYFPKATEKTLDLITKVGTQVGNGLDVTVKYIDIALFEEIC